MLFYILFRYYGVSSLMVDWLSMSFMVFYAIFIFPASYVTDRCGLRWTTILGTGLNCLGAWIKIFSIQPDRFHVVFIGHSIVALAQVISLNLLSISRSLKDPLRVLKGFFKKSWYCYKFFSPFPFFFYRMFHYYCISLFI